MWFANCMQRNKLYTKKMLYEAVFKRCGFFFIYSLSFYLLCLRVSAANVNSCVSTEY